ncbi:MAG: RHS repeat protein, partial [Gammaproteobacteria bacterium]|nr:RHS repeat protein [Gammaproteobacteria bacterium]
MSRQTRTITKLNLNDSWEACSTSPLPFHTIYDALGRTKQVIEGRGTVTYIYNQLSQMTSETRGFTDTLADAPLSGNSFKIEYTYALGGQLKSIKDPYGQQINYTHDKAGRLSTVTGSSAFGGIT